MVRNWLRSLLFAPALALLAAGTATAGIPSIGFDLANAIGHNYYFTNFYVNQTLGTVFLVEDTDIVVTHLGAFDMNTENVPTWDPNYPLLPEDGFKEHHAVAIFERTTMEKLGEVVLPAGAAAPIQDEGYRYLPLDEPITLTAGHQYVLAAWWGTGSYTDPGMDTFYLLGTSPTEIPSDVYVADAISIVDGCFNPNAGDGGTVDAPFIFNMFWGLYAGGANFLYEVPVPIQDKSWGEVKSLFRR
ncbi:MAG: hypothetical protein KDA27_09495 [Candidatus Eisenbacteria bacterium]|uniref:DUF4397 domain-containing protein n=1 Tax=Eiseniibacteriota bacterium TaxID=2212470 RepID=A0A956SF61_UNCEI|nr:hypothetical protein [Candidatus Eisenbacteria bacterium]